MTIKQQIKNKALASALALTVAFSLGVALTGPVGRLQGDPLSLWAARLVPLDGMLRSSSPDGFPMAYTLLDWALCLSAGVLALLGFARWMMPVALAAAAGLATAAIGLAIILFASTGVLLSTSAPLLSIGFGLIAGQAALIMVGFAQRGDGKIGH